MPLHHHVTFESLGVVKEELRQWLEPSSGSGKMGNDMAAARDALISVLIHSLAEELSDARVRAHIQAVLADLSYERVKRFPH